MINPYSHVLDEVSLGPESVIVITERDIWSIVREKLAYILVANIALNYAQCRSTIEWSFHDTNPELLSYPWSLFSLSELVTLKTTLQDYMEIWSENVRLESSRLVFLMRLFNTLTIGEVIGILVMYWLVPAYEILLFIPILITGFIASYYSRCVLTYKSRSDTALTRYISDKFQGEAVIKGNTKLILTYFPPKH